MANKKITELPLAITASRYDGSTTVLPIVISGTTNQISIENLSNFVNAYNAHTGSAGNTFKGPQTIQSTLSVTQNAYVGGNLVVSGTLTAQEYYSEITSASIIYSEGSTIFGNTWDDTHTFTGSIILNGVSLNNQNNRINQATASLQTFTASQDDRNFVLGIVTGSINRATASLQQATASLQTFTASQDSRNFVLGIVTGSINQATASIQSQTASLLAFTASQDSRNFTLSQVTASFNYFYQATASLQAFTASQADRNLVLSTVTGSLNQATASIQLQTASLLAFTASQDSRNFTISQITSSFAGEIGGLEAYSASLKAAAIVSSSTQVQNYDVFALNSNLYIATGSLIGITNGLMAFTAALDNTYATDAQLYELYQATASLNTTTGSIKGEIAGIEAYTSSLKGQAIVSSSTQVQNYDVFALNSNLYTSTGSIKGEIAGIEAYTSSLKAAISVSGTNVQIIGDLNVNKLNVQYISSSVLVTSGSNIFGDQSTDKHEFTGSVYLENSLILGTEVLGNAGLNAISASTRIELNSIEEYTASLKTAAIVSSSTQVQNYDIFGLNSNLYTSTGSLIGITNGLMALTASIKNSTIVSSSNQLGEIAGLQAYTSSLKSVAIVSSSQQIQNYNLFAVTSSANTFYGTQTISGSLLASGSSHTIQNGYVILQQVSQSLNFVDDTAAAAGGVPLGGLYRNGNFIVIRIV